MIVEPRVPDRTPSRKTISGIKVAGTSTLRRGVSNGRKSDWEMSCLPAEVVGQTRKEVFHARDHYPAVPGLQEPQLLNDQEQEDHDGSFGVFEVLQYVPAAHGPQRDQVAASF
jgi:hypothetical protein